MALTVLNEKLSRGLKPESAKQLLDQIHKEYIANGDNMENDLLLRRMMDEETIKNVVVAKKKDPTLTGYKLRLASRISSEDFLRRATDEWKKEHA